jgi:hypothetical protein
MYLQKVKNTIFDVVTYFLVHIGLIVSATLVFLLFWIWDLVILLVNLGKKK